MKPLLYVLFALSTAPAFAASNVTVTAVRIVEGKTLEVDVRYGGGCKDHTKFELKILACAESFPAQCGAEIIDQTKGDHCEAYLGQTVKFDLEDEGLSESYYNGAMITFDGGRFGKPVSVSLPRK